MSQPQNSYSNPAFCQQSEFYNSRCKSPPRFSNARQSPVGAQNAQTYNESQKYYEEQEFYEEMLVDDSGNVKQKKLVIMHNDNNIYTPQGNNNYNTKGRYEYLPMQNTEKRAVSPRRVQYHEEVEASTGHVHRYATIDEPPISNNSGRYALVPVEEVVDKSRYATVTPNHRYEYIQENSPPRKAIPRKPNPVATQKLHELLSTPKKQRVIIRTPQGIHGGGHSTLPLRNAVSPRQRSPAPKAQQKLNYTIGTRQPQDKRHTAVIAPMCSSPVGSVYSETTFSNKTESWMNLSHKKAPVERVLFVAALMMILCGGVTLGLDFYMISFMGRLYFLDFAILSGFVSSVLGLLGLRSRNVYWLPNRNYVLGYFFLIVLSLLTCVGLLVLLFLQPKPGTTLADMTSGAVCGMSVLSLFLAAIGVYATFCCILPPPDNRVEHSAPGIIL